MLLRFTFKNSLSAVPKNYIKISRGVAIRGSFIYIGRARSVLELEIVKEEGEMEEAARGALAQIEAKAYPAELSRQGVRAVWRYGIAFCGKKMWLAQD